MTKKSQREQKKIILKKEVVFPEILNENSQKISNGHANKLSEKSIIIKKKKKLNLICIFLRFIYPSKIQLFTCRKNEVLRIWSHLLKKSLAENFIFCAVSDKRLKFLKQFLPLKYHTIWIIITLRSFTKQREYGEIRYLKLAVFY